MLKKLLLATAASLALLSGLNAAQQNSIPFDAEITGSFAVTGFVGQSPLFVVQESGVGEVTGLGEFTYTTYLLHNLARVPQSCEYEFYSSSGVDGFGVLDFADGQLRLERVSAASCYDFPTISLEEHWRIASGTGAYTGATGKLTRDYDGDVTTGLGQGTFSGTIKL